VVGTADLPYGFQLGVTRIDMSGSPYTYVAQGDPNADGFLPDDGISNDVVYVPRDAGDNPWPTRPSSRCSTASSGASGVSEASGAG